MNRAEFVAKWDDRVTDSERLGTTGERQDRRAWGFGGQRSLDRLISQWRDEAETLRRRGVAVHATLLESCADELERELDRWENELLSIKEAAAESGYSEETLRRKARSGKLPAERSSGKKTHLKLRCGDLPIKPIRRNAASSSHIPYSPEEDARDIAQRLGGNYA